MRGLSANACLDSFTIRCSSFSSANLSSGFWANRRRLEVAKNSSCSSVKRFDGLTSDRLRTGALRALRPRWLILPVPRRTNSHRGLQEARI
jgi:hypothetical protein